MHGHGAQDKINNQILLALPAASFERLQAHLEHVGLERQRVVHEASQRIESSYFVNRGLVSLVKAMQDGRVVEIGAVGIEGLTDATAVLDSDKAALDTIVVIPGDAFRIRLSTLKSLIEDDDRLRAMLQEYAVFTTRQLAQTAACNRLHTVEERCARWLLIAHDSAMSDTFPLTHEFLAMMLGARRSGVTIAANTLKKAGLIDYSRGVMTIIDRPGLEEVACECYGTIRAELDELFPAREPRQVFFAK